MASEIKIYSKKFETYLIMPRDFATYFYTLIISLTYIRLLPISIHRITNRLMMEGLYTVYLDSQVLHLYPRSSQ